MTKLLSYQNINNPIAKKIAVHKPDNKIARNTDSVNTWLIEPILYLAKYIPILINNNLNIRYGLFNGAKGRVVDILYKPEQVHRNYQNILFVIYQHIQVHHFIKNILHGYRYQL